MSDLLAAFQFLSIFPAVIRRPFTEKELGRSVGYYPLVGLAIGSVMFGIMNGISRFFSSQVSAAFVLILWVVLTRAIHLDGFLDTCDGLFGGFTPEKRLVIMRDSRVGAFALVGGGVLLISMFSAIESTNSMLCSLLLAPVFGRWALSFAVIAFPYARSDGMGRAIKDNSRWPQLSLASLITLVIAWFVGQWIGLIVFGLAVITSFLWLRYVLKLIPGLTGDIYGATCVVIEVLVLVIFSAKIV
jgi:adenosylcobinamide-GDP ribazoletransferase